MPKELKDLWRAIWFPDTVVIPRVVRIVCGVRLLMALLCVGVAHLSSDSAGGGSKLCAMVGGVVLAYNTIRGLLCFLVRFDAAAAAWRRNSELVGRITTLRALLIGHFCAATLLLVCLATIATEAAHVLLMSSPSNANEADELHRPGDSTTDWSLPAKLLAGCTIVEYGLRWQLSRMRFDVSPLHPDSPKVPYEVGGRRYEVMPSISGVAGQRWQALLLGSSRQVIAGIARHLSRDARGVMLVALTPELMARQFLSSPDDPLPSSNASALDGLSALILAVWQLYVVWLYLHPVVMMLAMADPIALSSRVRSALRCLEREVMLVPGVAQVIGWRAMTLSGCDREDVADVYHVSCAVKVRLAPAGSGGAPPSSRVAANVKCCISADPSGVVKGVTVEFV